MARIPTVQESSVQTERLPTDYARPFATPQGQGAAFGDLLEQGAHVASGYAVDAIDRANVAATDGAWGAGKQVLNIKVKDPDPNGVGYARLRGKDAMDARTQTVETVNKSLDEVNASLNPEQQRMFAPRLQSLKEEAFNHVISHESTEQNRYMQQLFQGTSDSIMQEMQMPDALADPEKLAQKRRDLMQVGINRAKETLGKSASSEAIQSVLVPDMQQAALGTMQAALQEAERTGDPTIAQNAFKVMGKDLLKNHQKQIGGMVEALTAKAAIQSGAKDVVAGAVSSSIVPGGNPIALVDGNKFAAQVAALPADTPHREEIVKAAEESKKRLDSAKDAAVGTVVQRILKAGDPQAIGDFRLDRPGVSAVDRMWLRDIDEKKLIGLRDMQDREATKTGRARETDSLANYNNLITMMRDETQRRTVLGPMSPDQFRTLLLDPDKFPGGFSDKQVKAAQVAFSKLKDEVGKPQEPVKDAVNEIIKAAFKGNQNQAKDYTGPIHDEVVHFIDSEKLKHNGVAPDLAAVRAHGIEELARGNVAPPGETAPWYRSKIRRIDFERKAEYAGQQFTPEGGGEPISRGAAAQVPVQAATPVPQMTDKDAAAIEWLGKNPKDPGAEKVRAKLRAKGIIGG